MSANSLDVLAVGLLAIVASYLAQLSTGGNTEITYELFALGQVVLGLTEHLAIAGGTVLIFVVKSGIGIIFTWLSTRFFAALEIEWSVEIAEASFSDSFSVDSVSQFQNNVLNSTLSLAALQNARLTVTTEAFLIVPMTILFLLVDPLLTIGVLLYLLALVALINKFSLSRVKKYGRKNLYGLGDALRVSRDFFNIQREISVSGETDRWLQRFAASRAQAASSQASKAFIASLPRYILEVALIFAGALFFTYISISGDFISDAPKIAIFTLGGFRILSAILPLQAAWISIVDSTAKSEIALSSILNARSRPIRSTSSRAPTTSFVIEIKDLRLELSGSSTLSLTLAHLQVKKGDKVAIFGPSGSGKTTLVELIAGLRVPQSGTIVRFGKSPGDANAAVSSEVRYVPQRPQLIHASLAENISLKSIEETDLQRCSEILKKLELGKFSSEKSLGRQVLPDKAMFSGGEVQRIGIARALYTPPNLLLLDEATSALDDNTEARVIEYLNTIPSLTTITVAHRLSTLSGASKVVFVNSGKVIVGNSFEEVCEIDPQAKHLALKLLSRPSQKTSHSPIARSPSKD